MKCRAEYVNELAKTRDQRMKWWRDARYGMFVHYGIYSVYGKHEWAMAEENWDPAEYAKYVDGFQPVEGCCREWAKLAKAAGMKSLAVGPYYEKLGATYQAPGLYAVNDWKEMLG